MSCSLLCVENELMTTGRNLHIQASCWWLTVSSSRGLSQGLWLQSSWEPRPVPVEPCLSASSRPPCSDLLRDGPAPAATWASAPALVWAHGPARPAAGRKKRCCSALRHRLVWRLRVDVVTESDGSTLVLRSSEPRVGAGRGEGQHSLRCRRRTGTGCSCPQDPDSRWASGRRSKATLR